MHVFWIKDEKLLEKYNEIWKKVSNIIKKEFNSNAVYNEKYIKAKIKLYNKKVNTNFHGNKMPKESLECLCLSVILLDSVYKKNKYYPRVILKECNYIIKEKKNSIKTFITNNVDIFSDDSDEEILKKIQMEKKSVYGDNSDEEILKKIQAKKNSDEEN